MSFVGLVIIFSGGVFCPVGKNSKPLHLDSYLEFKDRLISPLDEMACTASKEIQRGVLF